MATHVLEYPFLPLEKVYDLETPELSRNLRDVVIAASTPGFNVELLPHLERQVQLIQRELMERNAALLSEQQAHGCGDDTIQEAHSASDPSPSRKEASPKYESEWAQAKAESLASKSRGKLSKSKGKIEKAQKKKEAVVAKAAPGTASPRRNEFFEPERIKTPTSSPRNTRSLGREPSPVEPYVGVSESEDEVALFEAPPGWSRHEAAVGPRSSQSPATPVPGAGKAQEADMLQGTPVNAPVKLTEEEAWNQWKKRQKKKRKLKKQTIRYGKMAEKARKKDKLEKRLEEERKRKVDYLARLREGGSPEAKQGGARGASPKKAVTPNQDRKAEGRAGEAKGRATAAVAAGQAVSQGGPAGGAAVGVFDPPEQHSLPKTDAADTSIDSMGDMDDMDEAAILADIAWSQSRPPSSTASTDPLAPAGPLTHPLRPGSARSLETVAAPTTAVGSTDNDGGQGLVRGRVGVAQRAAAADAASARPTPRRSPPRAQSASAAQPLHATSMASKRQQATNRSLDCTAQAVGGGECSAAGAVRGGKGVCVARGSGEGRGGGGQANAGSSPVFPPILISRPWSTPLPNAVEAQAQAPRVRASDSPNDGAGNGAAGIGNGKYRGQGKGKASSSSFLPALPLTNSQQWASAAHREPPAQPCTSTGSSSGSSSSGSSSGSGEGATRGLSGKVASAGEVVKSRSAWDGGGQGEQGEEQGLRPTSTPSSASTKTSETATAPISTATTDIKNNSYGRSSSSSAETKVLAPARAPVEAKAGTMPGKAGGDEEKGVSTVADAAKDDKGGGGVAEVELTPIQRHMLRMQKRQEEAEEARRREMEVILESEQRVQERNEAKQKRKDLKKKKVALLAAAAKATKVSSSSTVVGGASVEGALVDYTDMYAKGDFIFSCAWDDPKGNMIKSLVAQLQQLEHFFQAKRLILGETDELEVTRGSGGVAQAASVVPPASLGMASDEPLSTRRTGRGTGRRAKGDADKLSGAMDEERRASRRRIEHERRQMQGRRQRKARGGSGRGHGGGAARGWASKGAQLLAAEAAALDFGGEKDGDLMLFCVSAERPEVEALVTEVCIGSETVDWYPFSQARHSLEAVADISKLDQIVGAGGGGGQHRGSTHGGEIIHPRFWYWNLLWTWRKPQIDWSSLLSWQRVNHFENSKELCRKDNLKKNIERLQTLRGFKHANYFAIMPLTYILPQEFTPFVESWHRDNNLSKGQLQFWISKPINMSRGRGIHVVSNLDQIKYGDSYLVQRYVMNPLLLHGHKFDLRLYVLVTSFSPVEAFLYDEGFARFTTLPFSTDPKDAANSFIHLTNTSLQKDFRDHGIRLPSFLAGCSDGGATKTSLEFVKTKLRALNVDVEALWNSIKRCVLKALVCVEDSIVNQISAFELFGFDVLIDDNLKPWLIEVNSSPSMERGTELDKRVKPRLIRDTIALVDPLPFDRAALSSRLVQREHTGHWFKKAPKNKEEKKVETNLLLNQVLGGRRPRLYGETPKQMGAFTRIAPGTSIFNQVVAKKKAAFKQPTKGLDVWAHKQRLPNPV